MEEIDAASKEGKNGEIERNININIVTFMINER